MRKITVRRVLARLVPKPLRAYLPTRRYTEAERAAIRQDRARYPLGEAADLEVYWKAYKGGRGPSVILHVCQREVLHFDCYGQPAGHFHAEVTEWRRRGRMRMRLHEATRAEQVERALFEIRYNHRWYLDRHPLRAVRRVQLDGECLQEALGRARGVLLEHARRIDAEELTAAALEVAESPAEAEALRAKATAGRRPAVPTATSD